MEAGSKTVRHRKSIYDLTPSEMESFFLSIGEKEYRVKQVLDFLYRHPVDDFESMTSLPKALRDKLAGILRLVPLGIRTSLESGDGTIKHAYEIVGDEKAGMLIESVWMPSEPADTGPFGNGTHSEGQSGRKKTNAGNRHTICISSQLGCAAGCRFCATGKKGLVRQLSTGEIVYQVVHAMKIYGTLPDTILFMGMGEPMHNFDAVCGAIEIMTHEGGFGMSPRRIVVSTCGELERLGTFHRKFPRVRLAISLNAAVDQLREELMPVNEKFSLGAISAFIRSLGPGLSDPITLEYVVLRDMNDRIIHVNSLIRFLRPLSKYVKVNLIPYNATGIREFSSPTRESVLNIQSRIKAMGIMAFVRRNRGRKAHAACGQLAGTLSV